MGLFLEPGGRPLGLGGCTMILSSRTTLVPCGTVTVLVAGCGVGATGMRSHSRCLPESMVILEPGVMVLWQAGQTDSWKACV